MAPRSDLFAVPRPIEKREVARSLAVAGSNLDVPVVLLLVGVLLSATAFVVWYWDRSATSQVAPSPAVATSQWRLSDLLTRPVQAPAMMKSLPEAAPAPPTKECPYCLSTVPLKATRCPLCTSELKAA